MVRAYGWDCIINENHYQLKNRCCPSKPSNEKLLFISLVVFVSDTTLSSYTVFWQDDYTSNSTNFIFRGVDENSLISSWVSRSLTQVSQA